MVGGGRRDVGWLAGVIQPGGFIAGVELVPLVAAIDVLAAEEPSAFADPASIEVLHRELARLQAIVAAASAAFDASGVWALDGAKSASAWISTRCRLPGGEARRTVRLGRALRDLPACDAAWRDGDITGAHVAVVAALRRDETAPSLVRDEEMLVDQARMLRFDAFRRVVGYWEQLADPDGADRDGERERSRRAVHLAASFDGMWLGEITLDPIAGSIVGGELSRLERTLFEADWADAAGRLGRDPTVGELPRTAGQRRADALVEMATRSRSMPPDARRPAPLFSVLVGYETLYGRICELADGHVVAPGMLVPWLSGAYVERAVFGPGNRVEVGPAVRFFGGATRRAIELRDRRCAHPYCDEPAERCEVDHIIPYSAGGPTTQDNGRLLCGFHNRQRNQRPPPAA